MRTSPRLRRINAIVSALLLITFAAHGLWNSLSMLGVTGGAPVALAHIVEGLCWIHIGIGVYLSIRDLQAMRASGARYLAENRRYVAIRLSGIAIAVLMLAHMIGFGHAEGNGFGAGMLAVNVALVIAIAVHVICNVRPHMMSLGVSVRTVPRIALVAAAAFALMLVAFIVLYMRVGVS